MGVAVGLAVPGQPTSNAREGGRPEPPRIGYVNIYKVMWGFEHSAQVGKKIDERKKALASMSGEERANLAKLYNEYATADAEGQLRLTSKANEIKRKIEDVDAQAQKEFTEATNAALVETYEQIREVTAALAKDRGFDVIEGFPGELKPGLQQKHDLARWMLHAHALMPLYCEPELDVTDELIKRLNKTYPPQ